MRHFSFVGVFIFHNNFFLLGLIQIVPRLPPSIDGVGDYAFLLAKQMREAHGINTQFVVCDPNWKPEDGRRTTDDGLLTSDLRLDGFPFHQLRERSAAELLRVLSAPGMPTTVLLHYVGYGYEKRGCPVWLVRALREWKNGKEKAEMLKPETLKSDLRSQASGLKFPVSNLRSPVSSFRSSAQPRLITMFHELYASGPPWRSSFWTSPVQQWIAKTLASMSEQCFTNRAASANWLAVASHHPMNAIPVLPVFSNLGEPESILPLALRKPQMLVYGGLSRSPNDRDLAIKAIRQACNKLGIERLIAFGSKTLDPASMDFPVKNVGMLTMEDSARLLSESRVGYLDYFDGYLGKSTIFASYCAYALVPLMLRKNGSDADGLKMGSHFWAASTLPEEIGVEAQQRIAEQAREWYDGHSVKETSRIFAAKLKPVANHVDFPVE